jgi:ribose 5-phosphate isomerase B
MQPLSDEQLHNLVERVVGQTLGGMMNPTPAPVPVPSALVSTNPVQQASTTPALSNKKVVAIGTDHGGVDLKAALKTDLAEQGYEVIDCGTDTKDAVDYPDIALAVSQLVASGKAWRGVVIDGAGIGSCMSANKVPGVRAAMCYDISTAINSREHNDANVLTLGAGLIGVALAKAILKTWLATDFGGGRHATRVDKIIAIEKSYLKEGK